jgi:hypothetical protein
MLAWLVGRTTISAIAPSKVALSITKPPGTSAESLKTCRIMSIPRPTQRQVFHIQ